MVQIWFFFPIYLLVFELIISFNVIYGISIYFRTSQYWVPVSVYQFSKPLLLFPAVPTIMINSDYLDTCLHLAYVSLSYIHHNSIFHRSIILFSPVSIESYKRNVILSGSPRHCMFFWISFDTRIKNCRLKFSVFKLSITVISNQLAHPFL